MQMYEVTALAPEGPEEVYQAMVFAEDEDDALNQLEEQLKEQGIAHGTVSYTHLTLPTICSV